LAKATSQGDSGRFVTLLVAYPEVDISKVSPQHLHFGSRNAELCQDRQGLLDRERVEVILKIEVDYIQFLLVSFRQLDESL
jgi:hypothetical protein